MSIYTLKVKIYTPATFSSSFKSISDKILTIFTQSVLCKVT